MPRVEASEEAERDRSQEVFMGACVSYYRCRNW